MPQPHGGNRSAESTDTRTFPKRSLRHSDLRKRTAEKPLAVQFTTGVLPSQMRRGSSYVALRVRGDDSTYTYEPENERVEAQLREITSERGEGRWFLLTATGREAEAALDIRPYRRPSNPGGVPRGRWELLRDEVATTYASYTGMRLPKAALDQVVLILADAAEAGRPEGGR